MRTVALAVVLLSVIAAPSAWACYPAHTRLLRRQVEAQEDTARALQRQERELRAQTKLMDRQNRQR